MTRFGFALVLVLGALSGCASPGKTSGGDGSTTDTDGGDTSLCKAGQTQSCFCLGGGSGTQVCRDNGQSFGSCTGCATDGGPLNVSDMQVGSACGVCDGCCNGTTCVSFSNQTNHECGVAGTICGACGSGQVCDGVSGKCITSSGGSCGSCANGCCGTASDGTSTCFVNNGGACGTGGGACTACDKGTLCSNGTCTEALDPMAQFRVVVSKSQVYNTDGMGNCWDNYAGFGCAQPDLQVCMGYDPGTGLVSGCTTYLSDVPVDNGQDASSDTATDTGTWDSDSGLLKDTNGQVFYIPGSYWVNGKVLVTVQDYDSFNKNDVIGSTYMPAPTYYTGYVNSKPFGRAITVYWTLQ